eukprot:PhM_4_TR17827/c0_g1_i1/m.105585
MADADTLQIPRHSQRRYSIHPPEQLSSTTTLSRAASSRDDLTMRAAHDTVSSVFDQQPTTAAFSFGAARSDTDEISEDSGVPITTCSTAVYTSEKPTGKLVAHDAEVVRTDVPARHPMRSNSLTYHQQQAGTSAASSPQSRTLYLYENAAQYNAMMMRSTRPEISLLPPKPHPDDVVDAVYNIRFRDLPQQIQEHRLAEWRRTCLSHRLRMRELGAAAAPSSAASAASPRREAPVTPSIPTYVLAQPECVFMNVPQTPRTELERELKMVAAAPSIADIRLRSAANTHRGSARGNKQ